MLLLCTILLSLELKLFQFLLQAAKGRLYARRFRNLDIGVPTGTCLSFALCNIYQWLTSRPSRQVDFSGSAYLVPKTC